MSALPKLDPIVIRPVSEPVYAYALESLSAFVAANRVQLVDYFEALRESDMDVGDWDFAEFCLEQYEKTRALRRLIDQRYGDADEYLDEMELHDVCREITEDGE